MDDVKDHLKPQVFEKLKALEGSNHEKGKKREVKELEKGSAQKQKEESKKEVKTEQKGLIDYAQENEIKMSSR